VPPVTFASGVGFAVVVVVADGDGDSGEAAEDCCWAQAS